MTKKRPRKRAVIESLSASAEDLSKYAGNSAQVDAAIEAERAYARADAWARDVNAKSYGGSE